MGQTVNIGRRVELIPMDPHFHDISIGLYRQQRDEGVAFLVHTYSGLDGADGRMALSTIFDCLSPSLAAKLVLLS